MILKLILTVLTVFLPKDRGVDLRTNKNVFQLCRTFKYSGQSCKASTIVIYDSRVVPDLKIPHIMTLESQFTIVKCL